MYLLKVARQVFASSFGFSTVYGVSQSEGPLIQLLVSEMCELLKLLIGHFLKSQVRKDIEGKYLQKLDNLLLTGKVEKTCSARAV